MGRRTVWLPKDLEADLDSLAERWGETFSYTVAHLARMGLKRVREQDLKRRERMIDR